jgi:hypothetical protein
VLLSSGEQLTPRSARERSRAMGIGPDQPSQMMSVPGSFGRCPDSIEAVFELEHHVPQELSDGRACHVPL